MSTRSPEANRTRTPDPLTDGPAVREDVPRPSAPARSVRGRLASSGFARIAGISGSLVGTQALTSVLGLVFWTLAARSFAADDVGVAGGAVAMMMLLGSLGSLGFGTLLIARLPGTAPADRRALVRTCLVVAGAGGALLGLVVPAVAVALGAENLAPIAGSPAPLLLLAVGTGLASVVIVLDQAVLTVGMGTLQLERNTTASAVKVVALLALGLAGVQGGMTIFLAWTIGTVVSLPLVSWRTRGGRAGARGRLVEPTALRGLGRLAASHHALNVSLQATLQLLPVLGLVLVSAEQNSRFNAAIMVSGFVFALPYAVSVGLFAAARGNEAEVVERMRLTIPFGLAVSAAADLVLLPLAEPVLHLFGAAYAAEGAVLLRLVVLAGLPFVVKDHFIALRRVQGRTTNALVLMSAFLVVELAAASAGALLGGAVGLCIGWLVVLAVEALVLTVPLVRAYRSRPGAAPSAPAPAPAPAPAASERPAAPRGLRPVGAMHLRNEGATHLRGDGARRRSSGGGGRNLAGPTLVVMAVGVLVMAASANLARAGETGIGTQLLWVLGLVVVFLPAAVRILAGSTPTAERIAVAVGLGLMLQLSRLVINPTLLAFHDELIHLDTLRQIEQSARLFSPNPLLPISAYYPGLEVITDAVARTTGLALFPAAAITLLVARLVMVLAIIGLVRLVTGSTRAGAIGVLVYTVNPQQLFFNSQYSYQSLALPLAVLALVLFGARRRGGRASLLLPILATTAVVLTHHLTAALLLGAYLLWLVLVLLRGGRAPSAGDRPSRLRREARSDRVGLAVVLLWGVLALAATALNPGNPVAGYLGAIAGSSGAEVLGLTEGRSTKRLFADTAGSGPAPWEQVLLIAAVLLSTAALLIVLGFLRSQWRAARPIALLVGLVALIYPVIPGGHLTRATAEVGDRAAGFVFVGTAVVLAAWWAHRERSRPALALAVAACTVVFLGNVVLGAGPTRGQLPGPYEVAADLHSVDADNVAAADWLAAHAPGDSVVYGDRVSGGLAAAYGGQDNLMHVATNIDASRLLLAPAITADDRALIRRAGIEYLIVDRRLADGLPHQQFYVESGEYGGEARTNPVEARALAKFGAAAGVQRVYDNGSVRIYDLRGLR